MEFDFSKLIGRIIERFGSRKAFAEALEISDGTLSGKLNNKVKFSTPEIKQACALLDIAPEEIGRYFFEPKVR